MTEILDRIDQATSGPAGRCCVVCTVALDPGWPFDWCASTECRREFAASMRRRLDGIASTPDPTASGTATAHATGHIQPPSGYGWAPGDIPGWAADEQPGWQPWRRQEASAGSTEARLARWDEAAYAEAAAERALIAGASPEELAEALREAGYAVGTPGDPRPSREKPEPSSRWNWLRGCLDHWSMFWKPWRRW